MGHYTARTFRPRVCQDCGEEYVPVGSNQKRCSPCGATRRRNVLNKERCALWREGHKAEVVAYTAKYNAHNKPLRQAYDDYYGRSERGRAVRTAYRPKQKEYAKKSYDLRKLAALNAYGGPKCACCGETLLEGLTIDHINGDGAGHRHITGGGGAIYCWLKRNNYPAGFQVLCGTCNIAKGTKDHCPHVEQRELADIAAGRIAWG